MNRLLKYPLYGMGLVGAVLSVSQCPSKSNNKEYKQKPNIIYILADDLGYGELGSYGQKLIEKDTIKLSK